MSQVKSTRPEANGPPMATGRDLAGFAREAGRRADEVRDRSRAEGFPTEADLQDLAGAVRLLSRAVEGLIPKAR